MAEIARKAIVESWPSVLDQQTGSEYWSSGSKSYTAQQAVKIEMRRLRTAVQLNMQMIKHSSEAALVMCNLPFHGSYSSNSYFLQYVETMTEGLHRVILVRGTQKELISAPV